MDPSSNRRVAVIGAGISGVCAAAHLLKYGLSVTVFERCDVAGGVWHFNERPSYEPCYSIKQPSKGDYTKYDINTHEQNNTSHPSPSPPTTQPINSNNLSYQPTTPSPHDIQISHAPPGPCYCSLKNNVPLTLMETSLHHWPPNLSEFVSQKYLEQYIQQISQLHGVHQITEYNTRVESVTKSGTAWTVDIATLRVDPLATTKKYNVVLETRIFDAVVVASGHYHMPRIPEIPGLRELKTRYPGRVRHSKTYRSAKGLEGQRVLLIGSGVSSCDIAKDLAVMKGSETYQSSRGGVLDLPVTFLPGNAVRIGPVEEFVFDDGSGRRGGEKEEEEEDALPGYVALKNGSRLCGVQQVVLATGYVTSYPFLSQYHSDTCSSLGVDDRLLVTSEGDMVHNLHKDIFYIEDPTLAFVGVPYHIATFSLYDFQAQIVARVLGGKLGLPSRPAMRAEYQARVRSKGLGRDFHSLRDMGAEIRYVQELVEWANGDLLTSGGQLMIGHSEKWLQAYLEQKERIKLLVGSRRDGADSGRYDHVVLPQTIACS